MCEYIPEVTGGTPYSCPGVGSLKLLELVDSFSEAEEHAESEGEGIVVFSYGLSVKGFSTKSNFPGAEGKERLLGEMWLAFKDGGEAAQQLSVLAPLLAAWGGLSFR